MEDAAALGIVLQGVTTPNDIEERLELYQNIRRTRASVIQILSNVGADECHLVYDDLREFLAEKDIPSKSDTIPCLPFASARLEIELYTSSQLCPNKCFQLRLRRDKGVVGSSQTAPQIFVPARLE